MKVYAKRIQKQPQKIMCTLAEQRIGERWKKIWKKERERVQTKGKGGAKIWKTPGKRVRECVCKQERERDKHREKKRDRETEKEGKREQRKEILNNQQTQPTHPA